MKYQMFLILENRRIEFPVLPESIKVSSAGTNETYTVLGIGEINVLKEMGLREVTFESHFPLHNAPYVTSKAGRLNPSDYVKAIQGQRFKKLPVRFALYGSDLDININMSIENFDYEERAGEVGDIYFSITLKEWKTYEAKRLILSNNSKKATAGTNKRAGSPPPSKTHTVVKGESMWSICKKRYNDGSKYPELYAKNKAMIDARNKGTGLPKYTIYPNQVLKL